MRARKICSAIGCFELSPCPTHRKKAWAKTGEEPKRLRGRRGTARRRYVLERDEFTCHICGQVRLAEDLVADHVKPLSEGGADDVSNLRAACRDCHSTKSAEEAARGRHHAR
jgi:5-methylcytosine-specific restriction protein A